MSLRSVSLHERRRRTRIGICGWRTLCAVCKGCRVYNVSGRNEYAVEGKNERIETRTLQKSKSAPPANSTSKDVPPTWLELCPPAIRMPHWLLTKKA
jgi:hypothetical protein